MAFVPKVAPKQEKKIISGHLDKEAHTTLQRYAVSLGCATHLYIIGESLKCLFRQDEEFNAWLEENHASLAATSDTHELAARTPKNTVKTAEATT